MTRPAHDARIADALWNLTACEGPHGAWLSRVADTARRLVEESRHDADDTIAQHIGEAA